MKRLYIGLSLLVIAVTGFAQAPQAFNFQTILRNPDGTPMASEAITLHVGIVNDTGFSAYLELHNIETNEYGLVNVVVGQGTSSDDLAQIDWSGGPYFLEISVNGELMGSSPVLSVPYALYAASTHQATPVESRWNDIPGGIHYSEGSIGIGTSNPQTYLQIHGIPSSYRGQLTLSSPTARDVFLSFYEDEEYKAYMWWDASDADFRIQNRTNGDLSLNASGGNVGVGTRSPATTLDVEGDLRVSGDIIIEDAGGPEISVSELLDLLYGMGVIPTNFSGTVRDIDGNVYKTVKIGTQTWMAENLRVTHYNTGTPLRLMADTTEGEFHLSEYTWYDLDEGYNKQVYGALYSNSPALSDSLCPAGWHVSTDQDWTTLAEYLGGPEIAGGKLKETGTRYWKTPNSGATNESGFSALPGGDLVNNAPLEYDPFNPVWEGLHTQATFWSPDPDGAKDIQRIIGYEDAGVYSFEGWWGESF